MGQLNETALNELVGRVLGDLGGAVSVPLVRIGDTLGLYKALKEIGPATADELAATTGCASRYVREWLAAQTASGYIQHAQGKFSLTPEQAYIFAEPDSPVNLIGAFDTAAAMVENQSKVQSAFKTGRGVAWGEQAGCMFCAVARLFRPGYVNALVQDWLPSLDGVVDTLKAGASVADIGCGHGLSTILMAQAFPKSRFVGYDFHAASIAAATAHARAHGVTNVQFEVGRAQDFPGRDFDLITCFDCLHDMGDPEAAAAHIRSALEERRHLDDCRTHGRRHAGRQRQSGRAALLFGFDDDLCSDIAGAGKGTGARRSSRRETADRGDPIGRFFTRPPCRADAAQHGAASDLKGPVSGLNFWPARLPHAGAPFRRSRPARKVMYNPAKRDSRSAP